MRSLMNVFLLVISCALANEKIDGHPAFEWGDWEPHVYDEEEYFKDIDDYINITDTTYKYRMYHSFIQGMHRGLFEDDTYLIDDDCFGDFFVTKRNEYAYLLQENPFGNFVDNLFPEISLTYQFIYMFGTSCGMNEITNDFMVYCWYKGCWPQQMLADVKTNVLYILRDINDAAIIWWEGVPEVKDDETIEEWMKLGEENGKTTANIFK